MAETFLALLELNASQHPEMIVVERMQLELVFEELVTAWGAGRESSGGLPLGHLDTADLILNAQFLPPEDRSGSQRLRKRRNVGFRRTGTYRCGNEQYEFDTSGTIPDKYQQAWFPRGQGKAGYLVKFVIEGDGEIWFWSAGSRCHGAIDSTVPDTSLI